MSILTKSGMRLNENDDREVVSPNLGLEGIVSKRKGSTYRSGRSPAWLKMKNPACAAVKRGRKKRIGAGDILPRVRSDGEFLTGSTSAFAGPERL